MSAIAHHGQLALRDGALLPLRVLNSAAGFYIGTWGEDGPCTRESEEYWLTAEKAQHALDSMTFHQRTES